MKTSTIHKTISWVFGIAFVMFIVFTVVSSYIAFKAVSAVSDEGLKTVVEKVWCGDRADCKV